MNRAIGEDQIEQWRTRHIGWSFAENEIRKSFQFQDFRGAIAFVNAVADLAEAADHHPDITITYNRVLLVLTTHDAGGVTQQDLDLAAAIDRTKLG
jgi:4a-hydroxytetrahydrobiopterin dehydratase